ncbi:hypothetical protein PROFUN_14028, partial [Planoprotostelium fungivorum]
MQQVKSGFENAKKLFSLVKPFFRERAYFHLTCLLILGTTQSSVVVYLSYAQRMLTDTLQSKDEGGAFQAAINNFLYLLIFAIPVFGLNDFISSGAYVSW